ncbi:MAG: sortase [Mycobacteriaceae bacterium]
MPVRERAARTVVSLFGGLSLVMGLGACSTTTPTPVAAAATVRTSVPTPRPAPTTPRPAPTTTRATPPTPTPTPPPPPPPHELVTPAAPTTFHMQGPGFVIDASVCSMPYFRPLDPPGDQYHTVCWVESDFGVAPGSSSGGTSYILGHSWSKAPLVFNALSERAMTQVTGADPQLQNGVPTFPVTNLDGSTIVLTTAHGRLTYTVTRAFAVDKMKAGNVESLMANTPNRVVLITCAVSGGVDADYNIIVDAYLASSVQT